MPEMQKSSNSARHVNVGAELLFPLPFAELFLPEVFFPDVFFLVDVVLF